MRPFQTIAQIIIATSVVNCAPVPSVMPVAGPSGLGQSVAGRSGDLSPRTVPNWLDRPLRPPTTTAPTTGTPEPDYFGLSTYMSTPKMTTEAEASTPKASTLEAPTPPTPPAPVPPAGGQLAALKHIVAAVAPVVAILSVVPVSIFATPSHKKYVRSFPALLPCQYF
jgi:hypothetical protein